MTSTTIHDLSTHEKVIEFLEETIGQSGYGVDYASRYGEPGYTDPAGKTPLVVLGYYWCHCSEYADERYPESPLHDRLAAHFPEELAILEEQGVVFEWADEWIVEHEEDAAYRTTADSYSWKPSAILGDDCEWMTPASDPEVWIEWAMNDATRCIPDHVIDVKLDDLGWQEWEAGTNGRFGQYESGWHPGQDADPRKIEQEIRDAHDDFVDVVFVLSESSQFYIGFKAYYRLTTD